VELEYFSRKKKIQEEMEVKRKYPQNSSTKEIDGKYTLFIHG
jgi:hypothetical protein